MAVQGELAYLADECGGFGIVSVRNPANPVSVSIYSTPNFVYGVTVSGNYAYLAESGTGVRVMDVSDPRRPRPVGLNNTPGGARNIALAGDLAYVADYGSCLQILNISNPAHLESIGSYDVAGSAQGITVNGDYAYISGGSGLQITDISNLTAPEIISFIYLPGSSVGDMKIIDGIAFAACMEGGLVIMDVSNPTHPVIIDNSLDPGYVKDVEIVGNYAYLAIGDEGIMIVDVSRPANPVVVGSLEFTYLASKSLAVAGDYAYVVGNAVVSDGMFVVDISDPTNPSVVTSTGMVIDYREIELMGSFAYTVDDDTGLRITSIANPEHPVEVAVYPTPGYSWGLKVIDGYVYIADSEAGMRIIDVSNPFNPVEVGYYDSKGHTRDIEARGDYAFAANGSWFNILDCSEAINPEGDMICSGSSEELNTISSLLIKNTLNANPNPFNPSTVLSFELRAASFVELAVYDVMGREVACLVDSWKSAGVHNVTFNASELASGVYFARLTANGINQVRKLVMVK